MATLCFLGLITEDGDPTDDLRELAGADESTAPPVLDRIFRERYAFIFDDNFDLEKVTTKQLEDAFREQGLGGSTLRKGMTFFLQGCKAAGIAVSPHVQTRNQSSSPGRAKSTSAKKAKRGRKSSPAQVVQTTEDKWLDKFPAFDPSWDKEFQKMWMEAFMKLRPAVAGGTGGDVAATDNDSVDEDDGQEQ